MQQDLRHSDYNWLANLVSWIVPFLVLWTGLLMVSSIRYPHVINRYLRGKRSVDRLLFVVVLVLLLVVWHQYTLALGTFAYAFYGPALWVYGRLRRMRHPNASLPS